MNELCMVSPGNVVWAGAYFALRLLPVTLVRRRTGTSGLRQSP